MKQNSTFREVTLLAKVNEGPSLEVSNFAELLQVMKLSLSSSILRSRYRTCEHAQIKRRLKKLRIKIWDDLRTKLKRCKSTIWRFAGLLTLENQRIVQITYDTVEVENDLNMEKLTT